MVILQCQMALGVIEERGESLKESALSVLVVGSNTFRQLFELAPIMAFWRYVVKLSDMLTGEFKVLRAINTKE